MGLIFVLVLFSLYIKYPKKYSEEINKYCKIYGVNTSLVYGVVYAESSFGRDKVSTKGATGLMQIMPKTAEFIASSLNVEKYDLKKPNDNINFGVWYLKYLFKKFTDEKLVIYAYNAGEGVVLEWLKVGDLSNFPYKETRNYYKKVTKAKKIYAKLYKI